jgi:hypothetical protein
VIKEGEFGTFFVLILDGNLKTSTGETHGPGKIVGYEGLFQDNHHRGCSYNGGMAGGTLAIFLCIEITSPRLYLRDLAGPALPTHSLLMISARSTSDLGEVYF